MACSCRSAWRTRYSRARTETAALRRDQRKLAVRLFLALALLIAQSAAQAHAYSHLRPGADPSGLAGTSSQLCGECQTSAPLLATATGGEVSFTFLRPQTDTPLQACATSHPQKNPHYAFRSRAPPRSF